MSNLIVRNIDFYGGQILGVKTPDGKVYMGVRRACRDIGLTEGQARRQIENVQKDIVLNKGVANFVLPSNGGEQETLCIEKEFIPLWLAKISITPSMMEENPETVQKLVNYQLEAKDILVKAFLEKQPTGFDMSSLSPELQMFGQMFQAVANIEIKQNQMDQVIAETKQQVTNIKDTIVLRDTDWRKDVNFKLRKIGTIKGDYREIVKESYRLLEGRARCDLSRRLTNMRQRMAADGTTKTAINNANYLDVIGADDKLKEIYINIVNQLYIQYAA